MTHVESATRPSRRTIAKGAAWAVPAVAVAVPAASAATSPPCEYELVIDPGASCKKANANQYRIVFKIEAVGNCPDPVSCSIDVTEIKEKTGQARILWTTGDPTDGPAYLVCDANNMANGVEVTATYSCANGVSGSFTEVLVPTPQFTSTDNCNTDDFCSEPAAAEPEPATEPAAAEPEPATEPAAAEPEPATEPAAAEPEPATEPAAAEPEPATEPAE